MTTQGTGFCFPMNNLENDSVKLIPFNATSHAAAYFEATRLHPKLYQYMSIGPFATIAEFLDTFLTPIQSAPNEICFAIIDKQAPQSAIDPDGELAGLITCIDASVEHKKVCMGHAVILPGFQRKGVFINAAGLLLRHFLASPTDGGLGLLRVQTIASTANRRSISLMRQAFRQEGIFRWHRVMHMASQRRKTGNGRTMPKYADQGGIGRDSVYFGICWEDWYNGGRENVERLIESAGRSSGCHSKL